MKLLITHRVEHSICSVGNTLQNVFALNGVQDNGNKPSERTQHSRSTGLTRMQNIAFGRVSNKGAAGGGVGVPLEKKIGVVPQNRSELDPPPLFETLH